MPPKAALKNIRALLDDGDFAKAAIQAESLCEQDPQNYHAHVFLGLSRSKIQDPDGSEQAYLSAAKLKEDDKTAWQGLINLYESLKGKKISEYESAVVKLCQIFGQTDEKSRAQVVVSKYISFVKNYGGASQYKQALKLLLPSSVLFQTLEGFISHPSQTYLQVIELSEAEEKQFINREIGERRTRLGARIDQVTAEVKLEAFQRSDLDDLYRGFIDWTHDDTLRRTYEEKLLLRAYNYLLALPAGKKTVQRKYVLKSAEEMVIIHHPFSLAWKIVLEWKDVGDISQLDVTLLREYIQLFPDDGLSKVVKGFLASELSPFPATPDSESEKETTSEDRTIIQGLATMDDHLLLMAEGLELSPDSLLCHRIMGNVYLELEEFRTATEICRKGLSIALDLQQRTSIKLRETIDTLNITLATALITYQSPKNHPEAKEILDEILKRNQTSTQCLLGLGLIFEEDADFEQAVGLFEKALQRDPGNARISCELFWCKARCGEVQVALKGLEQTLTMLGSAQRRERDLKAVIMYRIGQCQWDLDPSFTSRKDRNGAYASFLASIQSNMSYAPAYTSLGIYYADYKKDQKRAKRCFHKAIELSPAEIEAAERLARDFSHQAEWDVVEAIAQRVIDSGRAKPAPGSRRKGASWPYAALGAVEINRQQYTKSIVALQTALRISPNDYHSWVGLGESYHNSGRYIAALKSFQHAQALENTLNEKDQQHIWFARYMTANVIRELGDFPQAILKYREVLDMRPDEFGVSIALLQTLVESSWKSIEAGTFGNAAEMAVAAIKTGVMIAKRRPKSVNLWKGIGDAFSIFSWIGSKTSLIPVSLFKSLLETHCEKADLSLLADLDGVGPVLLESTQANMPNFASILAYKQALSISNADVHARAVAWYNLGWAESRAHTCSHPNKKGKGKPSGFLKAAMRCFKRAIELEAGNFEFWNALGIACTLSSPKVAQHSFVRSLHLNERSASVWTNLGSLYLVENDFQLANEAFTKAQSADPDYAHAWLGQALIAFLTGDLSEARELVTHAFTLGNASLVFPKRQYAVSVFDHICSGMAGSDSSHLIQPLFALHQLHSQEPSNTPYDHLSALLAERLGDIEDANSSLTRVCAAVEAEYEREETVSSLSRYPQTKADLARAQLACLDYETAAESAETAICLSTEDGVAELDPQNHQKLRLSAHLTAGLAYYYLKDMDKAIDMFREALQEADSSPDVICLLAQVLWAKGGEEEKSVAREQLFDCIERHPEHVGAISLLGVIALLDLDEDALEAVETDLRGMRTSNNLSFEDRTKISKILVGISSVSSTESRVPERLRRIQQGCTSVMLSPGEPQGWKALAEASSEEFPAVMAVRTALGNVPPHGSLGATDISKACALTGDRQNALKAIMIAPWITDSWQELNHCLSA